MSDEKLADQIEGAVGGIKDLAARYLLTTLHLTVLKHSLLEYCEQPKPANKYLGPNAFLLLAAILLGFFGSILLGGLTNVGIDTLFTLKGLSLASFLHLSLPLFLVGILAGWLVAALWRTPALEKRRALKSLNYYVIGYFSMGTLVLLVGLSLLLAVTEVYSRVATGVFKTVSYSVIVAYVLHTAWILARGSLIILYGADAGGRASDIVKAGLLTITILTLSGANFMFNLQHQPLSGRLMDLELRDESVIKLTFVVANTTSKPLAISLIDAHWIIATAKQGTPLEKQGYWSETCEAATVPPYFQVIEPGESEVLSSYVCDSAFGNFLKAHKYVGSDRAPGRKRFYSTPPNAVALEFRARVFSGAGISLQRLSL